MPKKAGVDKKTLIEDNELFLFDDEVEPLLTVLCGKTLEVARMEVLEEQELADMKEQQEHYKRIIASEKTDNERMEVSEKKRLEDFEKLKSTMRDKKKNKQFAHKKVVARTLAKNYMSQLRANTFRHLTDVGFYTDNFKVDVLDNDVVPWLQSKAFEFFQDLDIQEKVSDMMSLNFIQSEEKAHIETVQAEYKRIQEV